MNIRDALIRQSPSIPLQRGAFAEIARLDAMIAHLFTHASPGTVHTTLERSRLTADCCEQAGLSRVAGAYFGAVEDRYLTLTGVASEL